MQTVFILVFFGRKKTDIHRIGLIGENVACYPKGTKTQGEKYFFTVHIDFFNFRQNYIKLLFRTQCGFFLNDHLKNTRKKQYFCKKNILKHENY